MRIALRVEVNSLRGLREGVPNLMRLFSEFQVRASFFFPMGPDDAGRWPLHSWRRRHAYGRMALLRGTLLPSPLLADEGRELVLAAAANGHEVGLFGRSPHAWRARLAHADEAWVGDEYRAMLADFERIGGRLPVALATPAWQSNPGLFAMLLPGRVSFSSCTRGKYPYLPLSQGVRSAVPEIPTTLPTVGEMLAGDGVSIDNVHEYLYAESRRVLPAGHVFALRAEQEGLQRLPLMEKLLVMWKGQDGAVRALGDMLSEIDLGTLPVHQVGWGEVEGGAGPMAMQSVQVPA
jgi:peptidoglycan/xylan/chitin deacetylase (PgdA/CDA1 family)